MLATVDSRVQSVVFDQLRSCLQRVQDDLHERGFTLDLMALEPAVRARLEEFFAGDGATAAIGREALFEFGAPGAKAPPEKALARSIAVYGVRRLIAAWDEALSAIEKSEDEKVNAWAKSTFGDRAQIDFTQLAVKKGLAMNDAQVGALRLAHQVLHAAPALLEKTAAVRGAEGLTAFAGDFARAVASSESMRTLLADLWDAASPADVDAVLAQVPLADSEHEHPVRFYAGLVRELAGQSAEDRERVLEQVRKQ